MSRGVLHIERSIIYITLGASLLTAIFSLYRIWKTRNWFHAGLLIVALGVMGFSSIFFWYTHRSIPPDTHRLLYEGIEYIRDVRSEPRPIIIHVIKIDLDTPGLSFLVTPSESAVVEAQTTSQFLEAYDLQLAVNGDFYDTRINEQLDEPVTPRGLAASHGEIYTQGYIPDWGYNTLYLSAENEASFIPPDTIYNAISGWQMIIQNGVYIPTRNAPYDYIHEPQPRTLFALDETGETLIIIVVDGRQPHYSEGVTLDELGDIALGYLAYNALNMDGGGSSTLVMEGEVLNSPIHSRIPGNERPIANHLGIHAADLK